MTLQQRFDSAARRWMRRIERQHEYPAKLGHPDGTLDVDGRPGYVFARLTMPAGLVVREVLCRRLAPAYGLSVICTLNRQNVFEVIAEDTDLAASYWQDGPVSAEVPRHGARHGWGGGDLAWIDPRQLTSLRVYPTDTPTLTVNIGSGFYLDDTNAWAWRSATVLDLSAEVPGGVGNQKLVVVGLDVSDGSPAYVAGSEVFYYGSDIPFTGADVVTLLAAADAAFEPLAVLRLYGGMSAIQGYDLFLAGRTLAQPRPAVAVVPPLRLSLGDGVAHTGSPALTTLARSVWSYKGWAYDPSSTERVAWHLPLPPQSFSACTARLYWTASAGTAGQNVQWAVTHQAIGDDSVNDPSGWSEDFPEDTLLAVNDLHVVSKDLLVSGWQASELLLLRIARVPADETSSLLADALLVGLILELTP